MQSLTDQDLLEFDRRGYVRVHGFSAERAAEMEALVWRQLERRGVDRDDPTTWAKPGGVSQALRSTRLFRDALSDDFTGIVDQLLGEGAWDPPKDSGRLLYSWPGEGAWTVPHDGWHWHGNGERNIERVRELACFFFINHVEARGGGTLLCEGSHKLVNAYLAGLTDAHRERKKKFTRIGFYHSGPYARQLTREGDPESRLELMKEQSVDGHPVRVVELTGEPGDAVICNGSLLHAVSPNRGQGARLMLTVDIRTRR